jgi:hypothetical protein
MTVQTTSQTEKSMDSRAQRILGGTLMVLFGISLLVSRFVELGVLPVLLPGMIMLVIGIATRASGWLIPAGILNGIGMGVLAMESPLGKGLDSGDLNTGGLFLLAFALGWFTIPLFSTLFTKDKHLWAHIPASILAFIGGAILVGDSGLKVLEAFNYLIPAGLIIAGLVLVLKKKN